MTRILSLSHALTFTLSFTLSFSLSQAEQELKVTQSEFDRQAEITRLLLEGVSSTHVRTAPDLNFLSEHKCHMFYIDC